LEKKKKNSCSATLGGRVVVVTKFTQVVRLSLQAPPERAAEQSATCCETMTSAYIPMKQEHVPYVNMT
jgi:hypothetical protein